MQTLLNYIAINNLPPVPVDKIQPDDYGYIVQFKSGGTMQFTDTQSLATTRIAVGDEPIACTFIEPQQEKQYPDCYLHVTECRSGETWIIPIGDNDPIDLRVNTPAEVAA